MDLNWISVGMSVASNIYRLDSVFFIRHSLFSKYSKFRVNSEKTVNSICYSDTGASIDEFRWISVGMSVASNIYRLDLVFFIRHSVFSKYSKFRVNSEKTVNSIFDSDKGASIDEFRWISTGYQWGCLLPLIFIDWTQCFSSDTLFSQNIRNFA